MFSGALWQIRKLIPTTPPLTTADQSLFDVLVLHAISLGHTTDNFTTQINLILSLLSQDAKLNVLSPLALPIFNERVLLCSKVTNYTQTMDFTFHLPTAQLTAANLSTLPNQLLLHPKLSDWGLGFKWKQWYVSPILGTLDVGYAQTPLQFLFSVDCPVNINATAAGSYTGYGNCSGVTIGLEWQPSAYESNSKTGSIQYYFTPGAAAQIYVMITHQVPAEMVLFSTNLVCLCCIIIFI